MTLSPVSPLPRNRRLGRRHVLAAAVLGLAAFGLAAWQPRLIIYNETSSLPIGLYVRLPLAPAVGRLADFHAPAALEGYAPLAGQDVGRYHMLKPIAAMPGQRVCARPGLVEIDDGMRYAVASTDSVGNPLPHYTDCRALGSGEYFMVSTHIATSLDSRYFGPIDAAAVTGIYAPLWTPEFLQDGP